MPTHRGKHHRNALSLLQRLQLRVIQLASLLAPVSTGQWAAKKFTTPPHFKRPAWESEILALGENITLPGQLSGCRWGQGPRVLLIHGWGGRGSQLGAFVMPLVTAGFEVIAFDGPAHGDSPGKRTHIGEFSARLLQIQEQLGSLAGIIGHSFGAAVAVYTMFLGLQTTHLVLIACPATVQGRFDYFAELLKLAPKARDIFQTAAEREAGIRASEVQLLRLEELANTKTLLIHDRQDTQIAFKEALQLASALTHARFLVTDGLGHQRILRSPEVIHQVIAFLKKS